MMSLSLCPDPTPAHKLGTPGSAVRVCPTLAPGAGTVNRGRRKQAPAAGAARARTGTRPVRGGFDATRTGGGVDPSRLGSRPVVGQDGHDHAGRARLP
jgi:hypothetical protein